VLDQILRRDFVGLVKSRSMGYDDAMRRIASAGTAFDAAHAELEDAVSDARKAGATWAVIAGALGVSGQVANQWFGEPDD